MWAILRQIKCMEKGNTASKMEMCLLECSKTTKETAREFINKLKEVSLLVSSSTASSTGLVDTNTPMDLLRKGSTKTTVRRESGWSIREAKQ